MQARKTLRPYQSALLEKVRARLRAGAAPLAVVPTGAGKTVMFSRLVAEYAEPTISIAHRKELIAQISRGLASEGCEHEVVAPREVIRMIASANAASFGRSFISPGARAAVASVDSLRRVEPRWAARKRLVIQDEGHHALPANKWGEAIALFTNATVVGWTATAERADGAGLDGIYSEIIAGPTMRELIDQGHLSDYRIFAPMNARLDLSRVAVSKRTGDFSAPKMRETMHAAQITGDIVDHYKRLAAGRLGLTFVADVAAAEEVAQAYCAAGVPAAALSAKTPAGERAAAIKRFARRELLQLVNVDLFGEGFDLSAAAGVDVCVEAVSMVRPTESFVVFAQQFGRALRLGPGKAHAIIIDHVGNVVRHGGPPDFPRPLSLAGRSRRSTQADDAVKVRVCPECTAVFPRELVNCPYCPWIWTPVERSTPEAVEGNLIELDPSALAELRARAERAVWGDDETRAHYASTGIADIAVAANVKRQRETRDAQWRVRERIAQLAGEWRAAGMPDGQIYRRYWLTYGMDVLSACALKSRDAEALLERMK